MKGNILNNKVSVVSAVIVSLLLGVTQNVKFIGNESNEITVVKEYKNEQSVAVTYDSVEINKTIDKEVVKGVDRGEKVVKSNDRVEVVKKTEENNDLDVAKTNDTEENKTTKEVTDAELKESIMFNEKFSLTTSEVILEEKIAKSEAQKKQEKNALKNIGNDKVIVELVEPKPVVKKVVQQNMTTKTNKKTQTTMTKVKTVAASKTTVSNKSHNFGYSNLF